VCPIVPVVNSGAAVRTAPDVGQSSADLALASTADLPADPDVISGPLCI
jgi:hypothetical protein